MGSRFSSKIYQDSSRGPFFPRRPYLENGPCFSISHSGPYAACAIFPSSVGLDIEPVRDVDLPDYRIVFSEQEWNAICSSPLPQKTFFPFLDTQGGDFESHGIRFHAAFGHPRHPGSGNRHPKQGIPVSNASSDRHAIMYPCLPIVMPPRHPLRKKDEAAFHALLIPRAMGSRRTRAASGQCCAILKTTV